MTKQPVQRDQACLLITRFEGFGDLVFHTPTIRVLSSLFRRLDVWSVQTEPFLNSPRIHELRRIPSGIGMPDVPQGVYANVSVCWDTKTNHSGIHTIDMVSLNAIGHVLRPQAKDLEMFWTVADEKVAGSLLAGVAGPIIVVSPAVNWPSRTFPLDWWRDLVGKLARLGSVVLVGKEITYDSGADLPKGLWPPEEFPQALSLYNRLSLAQLACLYSMADVAINMETATNPISTCNDRCWNIYVPTLTPPEFRVPFRHGSQSWKTRVVGNPSDFYPATLYGQLGDPRFVEVERPAVNAVVEACADVLQKPIHPA